MARTCPCLQSLSPWTPHGMATTLSIGVPLILQLRYTRQQLLSRIQVKIRRPPLRQEVLSFHPMLQPHRQLHLLILGALQPTLRLQRLSLKIPRYSNLTHQIRSNLQPITQDLTLKTLTNHFLTRQIPTTLLDLITAAILTLQRQLPPALNGVAAAPGRPAVVSDPQSNNPQPASTTSKGDPGADSDTGDDVGRASHPAGTIDQTPADHTRRLPSIGGHQIQAASGGDIVIASTTLQPGVKTTIDGTPIVVDGHHLVVNGKTSPLPSPPISLLTIAGQTLTPAPSGFATAGQSILPGGPPVTFAGNTFSLPASDRNALVVNGTSTPLVRVSVFKGSQSFAAVTAGFTIGAQALSPGGKAMGCWCSWALNGWLLVL